MTTPRTPVSKKTTTKKSTTATTVAHPASTLKKTRASNKTTAKKTVTPEERYQMIMTAAYFLAERHGFSSGRALEDWIAAEKEIDKILVEESERT